jgi:hypothetical protein
LLYSYYYPLLSCFSSKKSASPLSLSVFIGVHRWAILLSLVAALLLQVDSCDSRAENVVALALSLGRYFCVFCAICRSKAFAVAFISVYPCASVVHFLSLAAVRPPPDNLWFLSS